MFLQTSQKRVQFPRTLRSLLLGLLTVATMSLLGVPGGFSLHPQKAFAATDSTVNFQARLEGPGGAIAADGYYNIEFKLYNASGTNLWTEDYYDANGTTAGLDNRAKVVNGYITVSLGSQTAFPTTINWDQTLTLGMNVGGTTQTATPTYDGEMTPRLGLTAVPYAFRAGQLAQGNAAGTYTSTLGIVQPTAGNQTFQIQDQAAAGSYTICVQGATTAAGGCAASTGAAGYIQNQNTAAQSTSNFWISGTGTAATLQAASFDAATAGALSIGASNATGITIGKTASNIPLTLSGTTVIKPTSGNDSATAFQVQNAGGTSLLTANTTAANMSISTAVGGLNINGVANPATPTLAAAGSGGSLAAGTYYYKLSAIGATAVTTTAIAASPASVTDSGSASVNTLSWSSVSNASGYTVYRSTDGTNWFSNNLAAGITSLVDDGSTYTWTVAGVPSTLNATGGINLQRDTTLRLDNSGGLAAIGYQSLYNTVSIVNNNAGGVTTISSDSFVVQDTTSYNHSLTITNTGQATFKNRLDMTSSFQIQNAGGKNLLTTNTSTGLITIGTAGASGLTGQLAFANASNAYTATLQGNTSATASYASILPGAVGAANQCLIVSSVASTTQTLGYSSCSVGTVTLQGGTPGTADTGNINVSGVIIAGSGLKVSSLDTASAGTLTIGGTSATAVSIGNSSATTTNNGPLTATGLITANAGLLLTNGSSYNQNSGDFTYSSSTGLVQETASVYSLSGPSNPLILATNNYNSNLLYSNTGFELGSISFWSTAGSGTGLSIGTSGVPVYASPLSTAPTVYDGRWSGQITTASGTANSGIKSNSSFAPALTSSTAYTLTFYARASGSNFSTLRAGMAYDGSTETACTLSSTTVSTNGFQRYSCSFTSGTISGSPYLFFEVSDTTSHTFYLDDVQLSAGSSVTPFDSGSIALTGRLIAPATFQNQSDSTTAFQIQTASGKSLLTVDTLNSNVTLGAASSQTGLLTLANAASAYTVGLQAGNTTGASYTLTLPTAAPTTNQCLKAGASTANSLTFGSCGGFFIPTVVRATGFPTSTQTAGATTLSITPAAVGDLVIFTVQLNSSSITATGVSGGSATGWQRAKAQTDATNGKRTEVWTATASSTSTANITVTFSGSTTGITTELVADSLSSGLGSNSTWSVDIAAASVQTASTTVSLPSLMSSESGEAYWGYAATQNAGSAGATSGFTYNTTPTVSHIIALNPSLTAGTSYAPTATMVSGYSDDIALIARVSSIGNESINNSAYSTQSANFNLQAATSGSVTGVLQANASGSGDVLDLYNGSGIMTASFGSTGNVLLQASTNSPTAFQIQNASNANMMTVDTSTSTITFGNGGNTMTLSAGTFEPVLAGNARHSKSIVLTPEYAGAVLDAASDSGGTVNCSTTNAGTMTSGFSGNTTPRQNYYNWTAPSASQCYDVVLQLPIPSDWAAWNGAPAMFVYNSVGTNSTAIMADVIDSGGTNDSNYTATTYNGVSSGTTFASTSLTSLGGTYTAGGYMTIKVRMTSGSASNVRIGNITLNYYSKY